MKAKKWLHTDKDKLMIPASSGHVRDRTEFKKKELINVLMKFIISGLQTTGVTLWSTFTYE